MYAVHLLNFFTTSHFILLVKTSHLATLSIVFQLKHLDCAEIYFKTPPNIQCLLFKISVVFLRFHNVMFIEPNFMLYFILFF